MPKLYAHQLEADPRNANVCSDETLKKLKANIRRTKRYPALIVRPHPTQKDLYIIIDGHHRKIVLEELGYQKVLCQIWDVSDQEAQLALATLNRLRGTDIPCKRAELLASLSEVLTIDALAELIPETEDQIRDSLKLIQSDWDEMDKALKAEMLKEKESLPLPYTFMIHPKDKPIVEEALKTFSGSTTDRGQALVRICRKALEE